MNMCICELQQRINVILCSIYQEGGILDETANEQLELIL